MSQTPSIYVASAYLRAVTQGFTPEIAMILGSGLGPIAELIENPVIVPYEHIPGFPPTTVKGHAGQLVFGKLEGKNVLMMQGRYHYYEGHSMQMLAFPIRVMHQLGVKKLFITTATGGIGSHLERGDLMVIKDHINLVFTNPLIGKNDDDLGPRFPDTSRTYTPSLVSLSKSVAHELGIPLKEGTYLFVTGPTYETPAEVNMMKVLGADVVGMSSVPEALVATHCGMDILGITYIANMAAGISPVPLAHSDVMETMDEIKDTFIKLVRGIIRKM